MGCYFYYFFYVFLLGFKSRFQDSLIYFTCHFKAGTDGPRMNGCIATDFESYIIQEYSLIPWANVLSLRKVVPPLLSQPSRTALIYILRYVIRET
jgi:hypothetical protein